MKPKKDRPDRRMKSVAVCIFLALITWLVFGQTRHFKFVNYDDNVYVYENPHVKPGPTFDGIVWAFTRSHAHNWHPLTTISHMLDCRLYGLKAGGHHLTNVLLHTVSVILLFLVLRRMTAAFWLSAFVAAVFAIHPLHVESVAWVSERNDVLSGLFFMLTLGSYARYVRRTGTRTKGFKLWTQDYSWVLLFFALGLMSKPMLVTLPFVLMLLDYWPLDRLRALPAEPVFCLGGYPVPRRLVVEKIPMLGLAILLCITTLLAQRGGIQSFEHFPLPLRLGNAVMSTVVYLGQMLYPVRLAVLYPYTANGLALWKVALSLIVLVFISASAFVFRKRRPYLLAGWLWYLIMLVPVIGIVQVGVQARADRYTYLPQIGLYVLIAWAAKDLFVSWRRFRWVPGVSATIVIAALAVRARAQTSYWRNNELLWKHALACTSRNNVALTNVGVYLLETGRQEEGMADLQKALEIDSNDMFAHNDLGKAFLNMGRDTEAIAHFQKALDISPKVAVVHNNLGDAFLHTGHVKEAVTQYQKALEINPDYFEAGNNLRLVLGQPGLENEAIVYNQDVLEINPDNAEAHNNLGNALIRKGRVDAGITHFRKALEINPRLAEAHNNFGNALMQKGQVKAAIAQYKKALEINPNHAGIHNNLGLAYSQNGEMKEGMAEYEKALEINPQFADAQNNLAWALATSPDAGLRNGNKAIELAELADQLFKGKNPNIIGTLAAAYAEAWRFSKAATTAERAIRLATAQKNTGMVDALQIQIKSFRAGFPFRDTGTNERSKNPKQMQNR
jgi:tetratricopeptide (TPR) repeat protein